MLAKIGDVEVWRVLECVAALAPIKRFLVGLTDEDVDACRDWLAPDGLRRDEQTGEDWIVLPVQAFLLRSPRALILVDACIGNDKTLPGLPMWSNMRSGRFMAALAAAGAAPEDVTHVMCTHLHLDHVGWTTMRRDGAWVPTFPNARVMATQADLDHARAAAQEGPGRNGPHVWQETIQPLLDADRFDVVAPDCQLDDGIRLRHTPGHTPGHVSVEIAAPGRGAAVTGDLIHSPIQCGLPDVSCIADHDPALAARTRRAFMAEAAETRRLLFGAHFPLPSVGRVEEEGAAFRWVPAL